MGADAGGMRVVGDEGAAEGVRVALGGAQFARLAGTGQRQAGDDAGKVARRQAGLLQAAAGGVQDGGKSLLETEPDVGRPAGLLAQDPPGGCAQTHPAAGTTAVDPEQERIFVHLLAPLPKYLQGGQRARTNLDQTRYA